MYKCRISIMIVLIIMTFLYILDTVKIPDEINFAVSCTVLLFSISSALDASVKMSKVVQVISFIIDTFAILVLVLIPSLRNIKIVEELMCFWDANLLMFLSLFFTCAGQWAAEIKIKEKEKEMRR